MSASPERRPGVQAVEDALAPLADALPSRLDAPIAIVGVTTVPMTGEVRRTDQTVLLSGGRIVACGDRPDVPVDGARVIDGSGRFLVPGLVDGHAHLPALDATTAFLASGVTTIRSMSGEPRLLAYADVVASGRWPGPRIVNGSPMIDGPRAENPGGPGWVVIADPAEAGPLVRTLAREGYEFLKGYSFLSPAVHAALGRAAAETGLPLGGHCPLALSVEEAIAAGQTSFEHLINFARGHLRGITDDDFARTSVRTHCPEFSGAGLALLAEHLDMTALGALAQQLGEREIVNCPTVNLYTVVADGPGGGRLDAFIGWGDHRHAADAPLPDAAGIHRLGGRTRAIMLDIVATLHEAGVPLLAGTDAPLAWVTPGASLLDELDTLVEAGLDAVEALATATRVPGERLGGPPGAGTITVGAPSDLLLVRSDPTIAIGALRELDEVFVDAWRLTRSDLDRLVDAAIGLRAEARTTST